MNHERDEEAVVRVVRVIHPTLRLRALAAQRGVAREVGVVPRELERAGASLPSHVRGRSGHGAHVSPL